MLGAGVEGLEESDDDDAEEAIWLRARQAQAQKLLIDFRSQVPWVIDTDSIAATLQGSNELPSLAGLTPAPLEDNTQVSMLQRNYT